MSESRVVVRQRGAEEQVLARAMGGERTPHDWLARAVAESADSVLDLACGSGSLTCRLAQPGRMVVGLDLSAEHLSRAIVCDGGTYVQADAACIPFADGAFDAVVSSLGLGVVEDRLQFLKEAARVLRPGGVFAALTPSLRPFSVEDLRISSRLGGYLRVTPTLPGLTEFRARTSLEAVGLTKVEDSRARYHFTVSGRDDARLLVSGLRPAPDRARTTAAVDFLAARAKEGPFRVPLPMRRIVAIK